MRPSQFPPRRTEARLSALEPRLVFAAVAATTYEQYMLELINRARANPQAEATRLGIDLNEGVTGTPISVTAKQPLAMNANLNAAIRDHVTWLRINSKFQHEGSGNTSPQQRMVNAGYSLSGSYGTGENLGITLTESLGDIGARTREIYEDLFTDAGVTGRGHRVNLLNGAFEEAGAGLASGDYTYDGSTVTAVVGGQDFAYRPGNPFLTGVVYEDKIAPDEFYSPGEGLQSYQITATNSLGATYSTTSAVAGGYSLQLPAGTYTVTATSPNIAIGSVVYQNVVIGSQNVKRDFELAQFSTGNPDPETPPAVVNNGVLTITGTSKRDQISVLLEGQNTVAVQVNELKLTFAASSVHGAVINAGNSNDYVLVDQNFDDGVTIDGGSGDDTLIGTSSSDSITGGDGNDLIKAGGGDDWVSAGTGSDNILGEGGKDTIYAGDGDDRINGGGGNDQLYGETNNDRLYGGAGNDRLDGGGNVDKLYGEDGNDALIGGSSNDRLYGGPGDDVFWGNKGTDYFDGGGGTNRVHDRENIETVLNAQAA